MIRVGGALPPSEENSDLPDFTPERAHLLLREVYGDFPHHNNGSHDDAIWQRRWRRLAPQLASWYATTKGSVGCCFTSILAVEWQGVINRSWNSERPLFFAHIVFTKTFVVCRPQEIRARITRRMDL